MKEPIIAQLETQENTAIPCQVQATTSTDLAMAVQQYTTKVKVPKDYQQFAKVFSKEESK